MALAPDAREPSFHVATGSEGSVDFSTPGNGDFGTTDSTDFGAPPSGDFGTTPSADFGTTTSAGSNEGIVPGSLEDDFDIFDIELVPGQKMTDLAFRRRNTTGISSARPTYKVKKKVVSHFLGKKNMNIVVSRNEGLSAIGPANKAGRGTKGYLPIFEAHDEPARQATLTATANCVLSNVQRGGRITMTPFCGPYDPQNARTQSMRDGGAYHFFPLIIADLSGPAPPNAAPANGDAPLPGPTQPYRGGGYFVFDAHSWGRKELLFTLWCTRYEKRHRVRAEDILVAELRLPRLPGASQSALPSWARLLKERHASLHISKSALDECFSGEHVRIAVNNMTPGNRHFFAKESGMEIVVSAVALSLLSVEHEGLESKKWAWLNSRETMERPPRGVGMRTPPPTPGAQGHGDHHVGGAGGVGAEEEGEDGMEGEGDELSLTDSVMPEAGDMRGPRNVASQGTLSRSRQAPTPIKVDGAPGAWGVMASYDHVAGDLAFAPPPGKDTGSFGSIVSSTSTEIGFPVVGKATEMGFGGGGGGGGGATEIGLPFGMELPFGGGKTKGNADAPPAKVIDKKQTKAERKAFEAATLAAFGGPEPKSQRQKRSHSQTQTQPGSPTVMRATSHPQLQLVS